MKAIASVECRRGAVDDSFWSRCVTQMRAALQQQGVDGEALRDTLVLLPSVALLPWVRAAWARSGGWQPRIEAIHTWVESLLPSPPTADLAPSGDVRIDLPQAHRLLGGQHSKATALTLVQWAQRFSQAQAAWSPTQRAERWQALSEAMPPLHAGSPGAWDRNLMRVALAWAGLGEHCSTDVLWQHPPRALVVVEAAGVPALLQSLLHAFAVDGAVVLQVQTDASFDDAARLSPPCLKVCADAADEAMQAVWAIDQALVQGQKPVALVAQDRQLVRRIHAVMVERGWVVQDETGWTLSTTRAASRVMAVLRAVNQPDSKDAQIDGLKAVGDQAAAVDLLEQAWRGQREPHEQAALCWGQWQQRCNSLRETPQRTLAGWLSALGQTFMPLWASLSTDPAGRAVLQALWMDAGNAAAPLRDSALQSFMSWPAWLDWVEQALEQSAYLPAVLGEVDVVITPLVHTVLRPFAAVVCPGCDERLGVAAAVPDALPAALAQAHGVPNEAERLAREQAAFVALLRQPRVALLRRASEAGEPLGPSRWLALAQRARQRLEQPTLATAAWAPTTQVVDLQVQARPQPRLGALADLPERWSASLVETLRACPYRFFSRAVLRLGEAVELDAEWQARDHGEWLHHVLHRFHEQRPAPRDVQADIAALHAAAKEESERLTHNAADRLAYVAGFDAFAEHYVEWLQARDVQGWRFSQAEVERERELPQLDPPARLMGRIDRIDVHDQHGHHLIDYKTGSADALKQRVREPQEDTQLAVYAALLDAQPVQASYLALKEREALEAVEHKDVATSAMLLLQHLPQEILRLRGGEPMPALGEGSLCDFCEARGLCRRDAWSPSL